MSETQKSDSIIDVDRLTVQLDFTQSPIISLQGFDKVSAKVDVEIYRETIQSAEKGEVLFVEMQSLKQEKKLQIPR